MLINTFTSHSKYFFLKGNYTQFSFPSLCVLLLGNIKMTEAGVGETVKQAKIKIGKILVEGAIKQNVTCICVWGFYKK